jgi:3-hydroxyisobutyrate dehydrogenase-like beta-hydroxyacid dehydrogenase
MKPSIKGTDQPAATSPNAPQSLPAGYAIPKSEHITVGVVGLGHMGQAFAVNLVADGHRVIAFDRDPSRVVAVHEAGVEQASRLGDLSVCDVVVTSLSDDDALSAVTLQAGGLVEIMHAGAVHISMSTISPGLSRLLASAHSARGQHYVAAPVLGNPDLARARNLFVLAAGHPEGIEKVRLLLECFGHHLFTLGDDASNANLMKLAGNVLTATTLQSMGEVLALVRKSGIDPHIAFEVLTNSLFDSKVHRTYGGKIVDERYLPAGMAVPLAVKDLRLALAEAEREAVPMPSASLVRDRLVALIAAGYSDLDWSALGLLAARDAGLTTIGEDKATTPFQDIG